MLVTLGPQGSFSSLAAKKFFPKEKIIFEHNFYSLFSRLNRQSGKALLPLENAIHGTVREVWDFLHETPYRIWKVFPYSIDHVLAAQSKQFDSIASHSQALLQCKHTLMKYYPNHTLIATGSTSEALQLAETDATVAAIAPKVSVSKSGLKVIRDACSSHKKNVTYFGLIAKRAPLANLQPKYTSLVLASRKDRPGLLFRLLQPFHDARINITHIESRPNPRVAGSHLFYLTLQSISTEPAMKQALTAVKPLAEITRLGEY